MLWQILVREIYVLIKHYGTIESLQKAFENLIEAKNKPKPEAIEKCKVFTDLNKSYNNESDWYCLTRHCQHSFINILESGYFLNNGENLGLVFILDFNTNSVRFYQIDHEKKTTEYDKNLKEVNLEIEKINNIIKKAIELGGDHNVISKAKDLLYDMEFEKKKVEINYRFFYYRLEALNLIDYDGK
jgi:hypothetical protein